MTTAADSNSQKRTTDEMPSAAPTNHKAPDSKPLYTDEGLRVLLADDWLIYVVEESTGLLYCYNTELWYEWLDLPESAKVAAMIPFAHDHRPERLAKLNLSYCAASSAADQCTLAEWQAAHCA